MSTYIRKQLLSVAGFLTVSVLMFDLTGQPASAQTIIRYPDMVAVSQDSVVGTSPRRYSADEILKFQGIEPGIENLRYFLQSIHPDHPDQLRRIAEARVWVEQLADESFAVRQHARSELEKLPRLPESELASAADGRNPEVAASARAILEAARNRDARVSLNGITRAVCDKVIELKLTGLAEEILVAITLFEDSYTIEKLGEALVVTAQEADSELLRESMSHRNHQIRLAAIRGLTQVMGTKASHDLRELVDDEVEQVRLAAMRELANFGIPDAIPVLLKLMASDDLDIRLSANQIIRAATGQRFDFVAFDDPDARVAALGRWNEWIDGQGAELVMHYPLVMDNIELGRILISDYSANKVIEFDREGNRIWEVDVSHPWAVRGLPNGHRLVGCYEPSEIIEFDKQGNEVMRIKDLPGNVMGVERLPNGHTLAACSDVDKIVEYDRDGEMSREIPIEGRPVDVSHLDTGRILVALFNAGKVVELNRDGEVVWELETLAKPLGAQRLPNGNTLVSRNGSTNAIEYNRQGDEVARIDLEDDQCTAAFRTGNGDTVIARESSLVLLAPDQTQRWEVPGLVYCYGVHSF